MDTDLLRAWQLIHELSEQISVNQKLASTLASQSSTVKNQASHCGSGFALRRFNVDLSQELFDSELERTNAQIILENQTLLQENKQLSQLLKEYEGTVGTIMDKFRNHALAAQQHELTLTRHYETLLMTRESRDTSLDLTTSTNISRALHRLSHHLRNLLRAMAGEEPTQAEPDSIAAASTFSPSSMITELQTLLDSLDEKANNYPSSLSGLREDWALERESEITRLEAENEQLRKLLGIDQESIRKSGINMDAEIERMTAPRHPILSHHAHNRRLSSGSPGSNNNSYWDGNGQQSQQQQQQPPAPPPPPLGGMRMMGGGRRPGMFGTGQQQRSGLGMGRGVPIPLPPPQHTNMWSAPPAPTLTDRSWLSNLDLNR